ncbi:hypothetical protein HYT84_01415 [Candidatus Micrarchaeota archaeon]|nr:hypothetical protein [Candidatus Micrarchaeota archaeon]
MDLYSLLLQSTSKEELEKLIEEKISSFHGFLTREVAIKLLAKEKNLLKKEPEKTYKIKEIPKGANAISLAAKVIKILQEVIYNSGKKSRSMVLEDETGQINLKLWEDGIQFFSKLKIGDLVLISGAYEKNEDLNLGYSGKIEIATPAGFVNLDNLIDGQIVHVKSSITKLEGEKTYEKNNSKKSMFLFYISDKSIRCILWEGIERGKQMQEGDEVIIQNASVRNNELHLNFSSRILLKKAKGVIRGKLNDLNVQGENLILNIEGKEIQLKKDDAFNFLKVRVAEDISLETVASLKKPSILNSSVILKS